MRYEPLLSLDITPSVSRRGVLAKEIFHAVQLRRGSKEQPAELHFFAPAERMSRAQA